MLWKKLFFLSEINTVVNKKVAKNMYQMRYKKYNKCIIKIYRTQQDIAKKKNVIRVKKHLSSK